MVALAVVETGQERLPVVQVYRVKETTGVVAISFRLHSVEAAAVEPVQLDRQQAQPPEVTAETVSVLQ
tara:strand:+ start:352 stop:555 length:204 start_codon:yes stop_codon:yes gene_type:complete